MFLYKDTRDITDGITHNIWKSFARAIDIRDVDLFNKLSGFVFRMCLNGFYQNSLKTFVDFIYFPVKYYELTLDRKKSIANIHNIQKVCAERAARDLKDIIAMQLRLNNTAIKDIDSINLYYYHAYRSFATLLYQMLRYKEFSDLELAVKKFNLAIPEYPKDLHQLKFDITSLKNEETNTAKIELIDKKELPFKYHNHIRLALISWIYALFQSRVYSSEEFLTARKILESKNWLRKISLKDIYDIIHKSSYDYLGFNTWDYVEREDGVVYSPPSPSKWLIWGFALEALRTGENVFNLNEQLSFELGNYEYLVDDIIEKMNFILTDYETWKSVLDNQGSETLSHRFEEIKISLLRLKRKSFEQREKNIAAAEIDNSQVELFFKLTGESWKANALLHNLFTKFQNKKVVSDNTNQLQKIGMFLFLEKAKMMFISKEMKEYQYIYGMDNYGFNQAEWENDFILSKIISAKDFIKSTSLQNGIDVAINNLIGNGKKPSVIIIGSDLLYSENDFFRSKHYVQSSEKKERWLAGYYKHIPVYSCTSDVINNRTIVCEFEKAFTLEQKNDENWFEKELQIEVRAISTDKAQKRLAKEPEKWSINQDGQVLNKDEALTLIKTSVELHIWLMENLIISDVKSFEISEMILGNTIPIGELR